LSIIAFAAYFAVLGLLGTVACAGEQKGEESSRRAAQTGVASVYGGDRHRGAKTANGERVSPEQLTAAHRSYPFGTKVRVTNLRNGRSVVVRINDRGPFVRGRVIDVTPAAARALGFSGLTKVSLSTAPDAD
jgi:rare lipoprotein A